MDGHEVEIYHSEDGHTIFIDGQELLGVESFEVSKTNDRECAKLTVTIKPSKLCVVCGEVPDEEPEEDGSPSIEPDEPGNGDKEEPEEDGFRETSYFL